MPILREVGIGGFRCLEDTRLRLHPRLNWIVGDNGAGKTSVLEAIYWLGRGRSFRASRPALCTRHGDSAWLVRGRIGFTDRPDDVVRIGYSGGGIATHRNQATTTLVEHARVLPMQMVEPGLHRVVEDGPAYRRRFLDWGMFHVEPRYLALWRSYARALRQRNQVLRSGAGSDQLDAWTHELIRTGTELATAREAGLAGLREAFAVRCGSLDLGTAEIRLHPGWEAGKSLAGAIRDRSEQDQRQGVTGAGPHRAELRIRLGEGEARDRVSRGQQKLLLSALCLAQADVIFAATAIRPLVLLDDFTAELGRAYQERLAGLLAGYEGQCVITALTPPEGAVTADDAAMFHVEQGRIVTRD